EPTTAGGDENACCLADDPTRSVRYPHARVLPRPPSAPRRAGAPVVYEQAAPVKWCCEGLCRRWVVLIGFGVRGHDASTSRTVKLYSDRPQATGRAALGVVPVACGPFCGEAVEP